METEDPCQTQWPDPRPNHDVLINSTNVDTKCRKRTIYRCKVCRKKFTNHSLFKSHIKLHKVTRRLSSSHPKSQVSTASSKELVFQCRLCGSKHVGFIECFEHQRLHEQHSKYFDRLFTSDLVSEDDSGFHEINNIENDTNVNQNYDQSEQQNEVIIATTEDVELLAEDGDNPIINAITETQQHGGSTTPKMQSSNVKNTNVMTGDVEQEPHHNVAVLQARSDGIGLLGNTSHHKKIQVVAAQQHQRHNNEDMNLHLHQKTTSDQQQQGSNLTNHHDQNIQPMVFSSSSSPSPIGTSTNKIVDVNNSQQGLQIDIPSQVKAIYLNSSGPELDDVMKKLDDMNKKVDLIIKHLSNSIPLITTDQQHISLEANEELQNEETDENTAAVVLEGFPPSYSVVQAAKEQQQQEYYAAMIANRQGQIFKATSENQLIAVNPTELKVFQKKPIDLWVPPGQQFMNSLSPLSTHQHQEDDNSSNVQHFIPKHVIDKVYVESRSRANFAKNLCFAIFTLEERQGKNCTGRVFGKAQHKGQLDPLKVQSIKDATFCKYPCNPCLVDITWRKECVTAIDSGLRNENRTSKLHPTSSATTYEHQYHQQTTSSVPTKLNISSKSPTSMLLQSTPVCSVIKSDFNEFTSAVTPILLQSSSSAATMSQIAKLESLSPVLYQQQAISSISSIQKVMNDQGTLSCEMVNNFITKS